MGLAKNYMNKANAVSDLGDNRGRVGYNDQAIAILERLVNQKAAASWPMNWRKIT